MDDGFIRIPGERITERIPASIAGIAPHSAGNGAPPPRRTLRRRVVTSRPNEPFDPPNPKPTAQSNGFEIIPARPEVARRKQSAEPHVGIGCALALELLDRRIADGDAELLAVKDVVQSCLSLISAMPPLSHVGTVPLRPDDRLYEFFDQFLGLLRQQESQMQELQTMIHELI